MTSQNEFSLVSSMMGEVKRRRKRSFGSKPTLWASQSSAKEADGTVHGKCQRAGFYGKKAVEETNPVSDAVTIMGYMGLEIEDGLIELIKRTGRWENNNVKWQANGVSGEVDVILNTEPGEVYKPATGDVIPLVKGQMIIEAKSCSGYYANKEVFGYMSGRVPNKVWNQGFPKIQHYLQSCLYADVSKDSTDGCLVIYISRDEARLKEFLIQVDQAGNIYVDGILELRFTMADVYARYDELHSFINRDIVPAVDYKHTFTDEEVEVLSSAKQISAAAKKNHLDGSKPWRDKSCEYCNHRNLCMSKTKDEYAFVEAPASVTGDTEWFDTIAPDPGQQLATEPDWAAHGSF